MSTESRQLSFLVIQTAFIGDVVLATGIIEKLHIVYPKAEIDFLVRKGNESLLSHHPYLHRVLVWDKKKQKLKNLWKLIREIRKRRYDKVINVQRFGATGLLTALSGGKETIGFDKNPFSRLFTTRVQHIVSDGGRAKHEIDRNNELIRHFTDFVVFRPALYPSFDDYASVQSYKQLPYICIAPSSVWFTKQYPAEKWVELIQQLPEKYTVYLLGAASDQPLTDQILSAVSGRKVESLAGKLSFLQSAALMKNAVMNYVNDSAPMHFASAVNAPVTAVYCSTVPAFGFGPLSSASSIVETEEPLGCRPCGLHGRPACPLGHFKCAKTIRTEQLLTTLQKVTMRIL